jgi:hypothetical protein
MKTVIGIVLVILVLTVLGRLQPEPKATTPEESLVLINHRLKVVESQVLDLQHKLQTERKPSPAEPVEARTVGSVP